MGLFSKAVKHDAKLHRYMSPEERFWARVERTDGCWLWTGKPDKDGYGRLKVNDVSVKAHRFSYELHNGPLPDGMGALHECDNPACVNPEHLYAGTGQDNANDRTARGRSATGDKNGSRTHPESRIRGEQHWWASEQPYHHQGTKNGRAKLDEEKVREIRQLWATGSYTKVALSKQFGVSDVVIFKVVTGALWAHVK